MRESDVAQSSEAPGRRSCLSAQNDWQQTQVIQSIRLMSVDCWETQRGKNPSLVHWFIVLH